MAHCPTAALPPFPIEATPTTLNVIRSAAQCGHVITITDLNTPQKTIVLDDRHITEALETKDSFRLARLIDLYRASYDKDAFVATLSARLMLEHDRRLLGALGSTGPVQWPEISARQPLGFLTGSG